MKEKEEKPKLPCELDGVFAELQKNRSPDFVPSGLDEVFLSMQRAKEKAIRDGYITWHKPDAEPEPKPEAAEKTAEEKSETIGRDLEFRGWLGLQWKSIP